MYFISIWSKSICKFDVSNISVRYTYLICALGLDGARVIMHYHKKVLFAACFEILKHIHLNETYREETSFPVRLSLTTDKAVINEHLFDKCRGVKAGRVFLLLLLS